MSEARGEWRRGWRVVLGSALALGTALPVWNYVSSLFVVHLTGEFGWTRGQLASATSAAFIGSLAGPFVGKLADNIGVRPVLGLGLIGYACMFLALAFQPGTLLAYTIIIMFHTMIGIACGGAIFSRAVASWFENGRGFALGLTMTGVPLSAAFIAPAVQWMIDNNGWRSGYMLLAGLTLCLGLPLVLALVRERPRPPEAAFELGADWGQIIRSPGFWLLALSLLPVNAAGTGVMSAMAPMLTDQGISAATAAQLVALFAVAVIVARLAAGWSIDRFPPHIVAAVVTAAPALGCVCLFYADGSAAWATVALLLIGVQQGAEIDLVGYLLARLFGMRNFASAYGVCVAFLGLSGAAGVAWFGRSFDASGSYGSVVFVSIFAYLLGAALLYALGKRVAHPTG
ncbi:MFS transporter [Blastomonas sp.]|uniref:MFS transporter n=1 Tax=Blastomonas sp. TaxID=1909299 RepID=UPI0039194354